MAAVIKSTPPAEVPRAAQQWICEQGVAMSYSCRSRTCVHACTCTAADRAPVCMHARMNVCMSYSCRCAPTPGCPRLLRAYLLTYVRTCLLTYLLTYLRTYVLTCVRTYVRTYSRTYVRTYSRTYRRLDAHASCVRAEAELAVQAE